MYLPLITVCIGAMGAPPLTPPLPKPHPPQSSGLTLQGTMGDMKGLVKQFQDRLRRKPFFEYFLSEVCVTCL